MALPAKQALQGFEVSDNPMVDGDEELTQLRASPEDGGYGLEEGTMDFHAGRRPYAVRIRMIILLSLICWGALAAALAWLFA